MRIIYCLFILVFFISACHKNNDPNAPLNQSIAISSLFKASGLDVDWDKSGSDRIAYSSKGTDTYYDIHLIKPDGSNDICLTCNHPLLPNKHIACPYWHPSGKWLLMTVEEASHAGSSVDALPGFGAYCDIWIMNSTGTKAYMLVDIISDNDHGVIAPRFSHDGKQIVWTDRKTHPDIFNPMQQAGYWTIKIADFRFRQSDSVPEISNIRTIEPVSNAFYECYGFSPDDSRLIFCSNMNQVSFLNEHIYTIDTLGNNLLKLTQTDYNEHAFYKPDGSKIVWMSNTQSEAGGTDWWRMNTDGTNKERLTHYNQSDYSDYAGHAVWAGLGSFSANGSQFVGGRQISLITQEGEIMMVTMP